MKLFYCPQKDSCGEYFLIMAENLDDCEKKIRSYANPEVLSAVEDWDISDLEDFVLENVQDTINKVIENKKNWKECPYGMFSGEWN